MPSKNLIIAKMLLSVIILKLLRKREKQSNILLNFDFVSL